MTFKRSSSGQQNLHLFKGVDLIVYTEGGEHETLTKEDILNGASYDQSDDIKFWSKIFSKLRPGRRVKILSVGGCEPLKEIAQDIVNGDLSNVCVAMDKDYSVFWGSKIDHRNVLYTRTYSWENELFHTEIIFRAFERAALEHFDATAVLSSIQTARDTLIKQLRPFFFADVVLVAANQSFFCRKQEGACFLNVKKGTALPQVDTPRMRQQLGKKKTEVKGVRLIRGLNNWDVARDVYGKPLLFAARKILQHLIAEAGQKSLPNEYLHKFLIEAFGEWLEDNPTSVITQNYSNQVSAAA